MSEQDIRKIRDLAPGLRDPMAQILFVVMLSIFLYVLTLPGNPLNPIGSNSTFTGYFGKGFQVLVFNNSNSTIGLFAMIIPIIGFYFIREWAEPEKAD